MKVAIVGSGISGLSAAYALKDTADVALFEAQERLGGHSCTVDISVAGQAVSVDVGFIVCNPLNYKNLLNLLERLEVATYETDMSFALSDSLGFEWSSNVSGLFAWKKNAINLRFWGLLIEIVRFCWLGRKEINNPALENLSIKDWTVKRGFSETFRQNYLLPMGAAIWSTSESVMMQYPATSFLRFFDNHKLLHINRPMWRTVVGGSRTYVQKLEAVLGNRVRLSEPAIRVSRAADGKVMLLTSKGSEAFDQVILAGHSDESARILGDEFSTQRSALAGARYEMNDVFLHWDERLMPRRRAAWAAWNVVRTSVDAANSPVCVTYWMNALQMLGTDRPVLVTLNPPVPPDENKVWRQFQFAHPQFDAPALAATREIHQLQGKDGIWFAGAWLGYGFHEDGLKSGLAVALALGGRVDWQPVDVPFLPSNGSASASKQLQGVA
jgi:predicted NAD/FAD-binding protein